MNAINKAVRGRFGTWWHLIQTELPSGKSQVLTTHCNRPSVEKILLSLHTNRETNTNYVYTIDPTAVHEPYRRCDKCICRTKG
jgi:hypothetical protein